MHTDPVPTPISTVATLQSGAVITIVATLMLGFAIASCLMRHREH